MALFETMDALGQTMLMYDLAGQWPQCTEGASRLLTHDPEASVIRESCARLARTVAQQRGRATPADGGSTYSRVDVRTGRGVYRLRACVHRPGSADGSSKVVIAMELRAGDAPTEVDSVDRYKFTAAESRVASLLAEGRSNQEIAQQLTISPFTARRHTERVLQKMGVKRRSRVAALLTPDHGSARS